MPHVIGKSGWWLSVDDGVTWVRFTGLRHVEAALAECGVPVGETKMQALHWAYEAALEGSVHGRQRIFGPLPTGVHFHSGAYHNVCPAM